MASTNVTSSTLTTWKKNVDASLSKAKNKDSKNLIGNFENIKTYVAALKKITDAKDSADSDLSYQFNDLTKLCNNTITALDTGITKFDKALKSFIDTHKSAESAAKDATLQTKDQFKESASKISAIKWS